MEAVKKAEQAYKESKKLKPLYQPLYGDSYHQRRQTQQQHDRFCWRVGLGIMTVLTGLFIWAMITIL